MTQFSLQVVSDIHLEHRKRFTVNPLCRNLALCGDIGHPGTKCYTSFIRDCSTKFKNVFVIFGNHEYYTPSKSKGILTMDDIKETTKDFPNNVYFLDNSAVFVNVHTNSVTHNVPDNAVESDYIQIIGSTLWARMDAKAQYILNDFKKIYTSEGRLTLYDVHNFHEDSVEFILTRLQGHPNIKSVLLTHHGTHPVCNGAFAGSELQTAFATFIPDLYKNRNLVVSVSGHTHSSIDETLSFDGGHTIRFVSNMPGYPGEKKNVVNYAGDKVIDI